ncbi:hypothetical protein IWQ60_008320 [Tieghemiomyces parasiticus]|uniref:RRM domain-containing protein n=1 Tax=Tieghemiomyces parasiticus TaxID=78921 RepID=A0A9W8DLX7_9FUNG|nr:hypothetical protein IWQ60_008320 [Tieghemiomyces parasiticus]
MSTKRSGEFEDAAQPAKEIKLETPEVEPPKTGSKTKVLVQNLTNKVKEADLAKLFADNGLSVTRINKPNGRSTATLHCPSVEAAEAVAKLLDATPDIARGQLKCRVLKPRDQMQQAVIDEAENGSDGEPVDLALAIANQTTPLWKRPYFSQLFRKRDYTFKQLNSVTETVMGIRGVKPESLAKVQWLRDLSKVKMTERNAGIAAAKQRRIEALAEVGLPPYEELKARNEPISPETLEIVKSIHARIPAPFHDNAPCHVLATVPSPVLDGYRNKCEFGFGTDADGQPTLGFMAGKFSRGTVTVGPPDLCRHVSPVAKALVTAMRDHVRSHPQWPVYNRVTKSGVWRLLVTRTHASGENMVIVQYDPTGLSDEAKAELRRGLCDLFPTTVSADSPVPAIRSLYVQESTDLHNGLNPALPFHLIQGEPHVYENLLGLRFQISPNSFFQANTRGAERLYAIVRRWAMGQDSPYTLAVDREDPLRYFKGAADEEDAIAAARLEAERVKRDAQLEIDDAAATAAAVPSDAVLLDLCCGTGTIGLSMAGAFRRVVGIESIPSAIEDAKLNAAANGITNVTFHAGRVEDLLPKQLTELRAEAETRGVPSTAVAILDPPRPGLDASAISAVRTCAAISRVVFIACDLKSSKSNIVDLCRPPTNKFPGEPFRPVRAVPVDLFPHTEHCEVVVELVRDPEAPKAEPEAKGQKIEAEAEPEKVEPEAEA